MNCTALFLSSLLLCGQEDPATGTSTAPEVQRAWEAERAAWNRERDELLARIATLENEVLELTERRMAREAEWLQYTKVIAGLAGPILPADASFESDLAEEEREKEAERAIEVARLDARSKEVFLAMRSLFVAEGVEGYDLLEVGAVRDGFTGPVVLRLLDELRRPIGSLTAERMRLEGSLSGHTLTLLFEEGYERRGGLKIPFQGSTLADLSQGVRKVVLPMVDPEPWREALPELFEARPEDELRDDGLWDRARLRGELNALLRLDATSGYYSLDAVGGVLEDVMLDVQLLERDLDGALLRRLFADRMTVETADRGVVLTLESGVQLRGDRKTPFLEGRYRIFLPRADVAAWTEAGVPGLSLPHRERARVEEAREATSGDPAAKDE